MVLASLTVTAIFERMNSKRRAKESHATNIFASTSADASVSINEIAVSKKYKNSIAVT